MSEYSPVWPHGGITKAFTDIYTVRGTNITHFKDMTIQHSRNMTIINSEGDLTLINTVRLNEEGLKQLDELGTVKQIISIGAFHGRDDAFYVDRYNAVLWGVQELTGSNPQAYRLKDAVKLPLITADFHPYKNASPLEGFLFLDREEGIIITCDSIKNWIEIDCFFNEETALRAQSSGEIAVARISPIWLDATGVQKRDFEPLLKLNFKHLISAHGDVLYDTAADHI